MLGGKDERDYQRRCVPKADKTAVVYTVSFPTVDRPDVLRTSESVQFVPGAEAVSTDLPVM